MHNRERQAIEALIAREQAGLSESTDKPELARRVGRIEGMRAALQEAEVTGEEAMQELDLSQMHDRLRRLESRVESLGNANEIAASVCRRLDEDFKRISAQKLDEKLNVLR